MPSIITHDKLLNIGYRDRRHQSSPNEPYATLWVSDLPMDVLQEFQRQMKINKDTIIFFKSLYWDYQVSKENIITIMEFGECNGLTRKNLLSRALKSRRWYEIKKILPPDLLKEALSEDVLKTLFPKSLSRKYNYVKKLLYP